MQREEELLARPFSQALMEEQVEARSEATAAMRFSRTA
jgi:hypothetical protein